jgi:hypothetical protein
MALPNILVKFNTHTATKGDASTFGHVKLSDATDSTSKAEDSVGASAYALKLAYDLASTANTTANSALSLGSAAYKYKGSKADLTALNAVSNPQVGDVYNIGTDADGANYAWNGTSWDNLGAVVKVDSSWVANSTNPVESQLVKTALDGKSASDHVHGNIGNDGKLGTASRVVIADANKLVDVSDITTTELGYLDGVTSNIQTQLNAKLEATDFVASDADPEALATAAAAGTATTYARGDHKHAGPTIRLTSDASCTATQLTGTSTIDIAVTLATVNTDTSATGPSAATQATNGGSFNVPNVQANGKGLVTDNNDITVTLPTVKAGTGIDVTDGTGDDLGDITITNTGVRSVAEGTTSGNCVSVNTNGTSADVPVKVIRGTISTPITKNTDVTVGSYIKGKGGLKVFIDGVLCEPTTTYVEQGSNNAASTTIQFVDDIDNSYVVTYIVG